MTGTIKANDVEATVADLQQQDIVGRIWRKDYTVWQPDPTEITNRLGWLTVTDLMREQVPALTAFAREVRDAGFRHVVLLGMGGSSLGPEVLRHTFRNRKGYPGLIVLDSTVPAWIRSVADAIDPAYTLFLVSSKSGTTLETLCLYQYFYNLVQTAVGEKEAGQNFVAITDVGTPLAKLAAEMGFRRTFLNPSDIGGRYSILSYFGLVPAVLSGVDIATLLDRAEQMREGCASGVPIGDNPGARLGAIMGTLAQHGRDKLTLVTSPTINSFGLWVEQLIAESTGKKGKGIIPIADEPLAGPDDYRNDRLFIYLRLEGDKNAATDGAMERIESSGQPVLRLELHDRYDLGAEFFRWEFATAVAGATLGIHPFNQPDVQKAKDMTDRVLREYQQMSRFPEIETARSLNGLMAHAKPGNYLAIMAYVCDTPRLNRALTELRRKVTAKYHIATTLGYGPRFLHSTGQLHKGGPDRGLFLQLIASHKQYLPIPGKSYPFEVLADAQALGDFQALNSLGRHIIRIHLGLQTMAAIRRLTSTL